MQMASYLLTSYVGILLLYYFVAQLLPRRMSWWKIALCLIPALSAHLTKYFLGSFSPVSQGVSVLCAIAMCTIYPLLFFGGAKWKRIGFTVFFFALQMLMDTVCYGIVRPIWGSETVTYSFQQMICYMSVGWSLYILVCSFCVLLSRMISMRRFQAFHVLFLIFPVSQIILVYCSIFHILNAVWVLGVVAGLGAEIALLGYTISQEKKAALEAELRDARHTMELEQAHYKAVEQRQEELARIRHDFNNQLAAISQLIRRGEDEDAQHMIRLLADDIGKTKENPYCAIPVVNAILTEKDQACREAGVALEVELDLPRDIRVEPLHLCSIFGNLLDNAIRGARESGGERPVVRLTSKVEGDYLFIKTENPAPPPANQPAQGHGYGSRILKDLAARYGGSYQGTYQDDTYTAAVSLLVQ